MILVFFLKFSCNGNHDGPIKSRHVASRSCQRVARFSSLSLSPFFSLERVLQCGREREIAMLSSSPAADLKSCASLFERVGSKFFKASKDHQKIGRSRYIMLQFFFY